MKIKEGEQITLSYSHTQVIKFITQKYRIKVILIFKTTNNLLFNENI